MYPLASRSPSPNLTPWTPIAARAARALWCACLAASLLLSPARGFADVSPSPVEEPPAAAQGAGDAVSPGWLPGLAAIVPGVALHGSGHAAAGDWDTAWKLLAVEAAGAALMTTGILLLAKTGASRRTATPSVVLLVVGGGLFFDSWFADLYGAFGAGSGAAPALSPWVEVSLGYRYVYDPQFAYRHFAHLNARGRVRAWRLDAEAWIASDDDNQRWRGAVAWRAYGVEAAGVEPRADAVGRVTAADAAPPDGTALDLVLGVVYHRHGTEGFSFLAPELSIQGRLDMRRFSPTLSGSFFDLHLGWGVELYDYGLPGLGLGTDIADELLARFAYGVYIGQGRGEVSLFYDHRKDGYEAGLSLRSGTNGALGHLGVEGSMYLSDDWGVSASFAVGSAYVTGVSAMYRFGGQPL
jgi:hypothetical protein